MYLKILLIHFFFAFPILAFAQSDTNQNLKKDTSDFKIVEVLPIFPGGDKAMFRYISKNLKYPKEAKENRIHGDVTVSFIVSMEGKIKDVTIEKGLGYGCDEEALRVIKNMPNWTPGKQNNRDVDVLYKLPIRFNKGDPYYFVH
jgi:TonB family protein